jgi:hypothetical protein
MTESLWFERRQEIIPIDFPDRRSGAERRSGRDRRKSGSRRSRVAADRRRRVFTYRPDAPEQNM